MDYGRSTGAFRRRGRGRRRFLDIALGAGRAAPIDAADHCLVVLGRHVEHLQFLEVLLGDRPALAPEESFHQRMLADDPDEAAHQAEAFLKHKPLSVYYDEVAIKGLALAQLERQSGRTRSRPPNKYQRSRRMGHRRPFRP